jgi:hypothetical protein
VRVRPALDGVEVSEVVYLHLVGQRREGGAQVTYDRLLEAGWRVQGGQGVEGLDELGFHGTFIR